MASKPFVVSERCTRACTLHPDNLPFSEDLLTWYSDRRTYDFMIAEGAKKGRKLTLATLGRHRKHLDYADDSIEIDVAGEGDTTVDHLKVLQLMIKQGAKRANTWRVGPAETMKAMELYYRLTQGSAMKDLFAALTATAANDSGTEAEFDAGSLSSAEVESVGADDDS